MGVREQSSPGSFRGIPFLVNSETRTGGKKTVPHEFVNNDNRFTEELGKAPPVFTMQAIVHGDIQKRLDLERVLEIPGLGTLVHPIYGTIEVKSTVYSVTSNQSNIGRFNFSITFESSKSNITAEPDLLTNSAVSASAEQARSSLFTALEDSYEEPQIPDTVQTSAEKLTEILDDVNLQISSVVNATQEGAAGFTSVVDRALTEVYTTIQQGSKLRSTLEAVYTSGLLIVSTPQTLYDAWLDLTSFGIGDVYGDINTVFRFNKENDRSVMNEHTRINALINLYESTSYREFETDQDLQTAQTTLDDLFEQFMRNYDKDLNEDLKILAKDADVRASMSALRNITRKVLDQKEKNVWKVVTIEPGLSSMALTSFRYYGNLDNLSLIETLNSSINWSNFNAQIQAVSQ